MMVIVRCAVAKNIRDASPGFLFVKIHVVGETNDAVSFDLSLSLSLSLFLFLRKCRVNILEVFGIGFM